MSNRWHIDVSGPNEAAGGGDYYYINATISISSDPSALLGSVSGIDVSDVRHDVMTGFFDNVGHRNNPVNE